MKPFRSSFGTFLCCSYLALYLIAWLYTVGFLLVRPAPPEFNPPSIVALPWTFVILPRAHAWGLLNWYDRHTGSPILYGTVMALVLAPGALLNAAILYALGRLMDGARRN